MEEYSFEWFYHKHCKSLYDNVLNFTKDDQEKINPILNFVFSMLDMENCLTLHDRSDNILLLQLANTYKYIDYDTVKNTFPSEITPLGEPINIMDIDWRKTIRKNLNK